ncbi:MAG: acyl--CoA ligase, partial [Nitrospirae bacterium]|nr:acyl--CoA ligase [Nitrospirota bacterium]
MTFSLRIQVVITMNVFDIFKDRAVKQPGHHAIVSGGVTFTYSGLLKEIESKAEILSKAGLQKGSCLGIHLTNSPEYIIMTYAGWMLGACIVPVASEMTPEEKLHLCSTIALDAVIARSRDSQLFDPVRIKEPTDLSNGLSLLPVRKSRQHPKGFHEINPAFLRFTSGTTGSAKGVVISHESIKDRILAANRVLNIGPDDKVLWLLSMAYHFTVSIVSYLSFGAAIVLSAGFLGELIIKALQNMKCTIISASPTHYQLMNNTGAADLSGLRLAISTTSGLASEIADRFYQLFHVPLCQAYGIIEVGLPFINVDNPVGKSKSVGKLLPDFQALLEDSGLGDNLKTIKLRGKGFFDAYYEPWRLRSDCLKDGW